MSEKMITMLEDALVEIDSLLSMVEIYAKEKREETLFHEYISRWTSILDGGRYIHLGPEGKEIGLDEGVYNVYDVLGSMYTVFHTHS
jgi:hypothetical protein